MKTIEEAAKEYVNEKFREFTFLDIICEDTAIDGLGDEFKDGVEFAQRFCQIERDKDGFLTDRQYLELKANSPFIAVYQENIGESDGIYELFYDFDSLYNNKNYTHWRPVNLK